MTGEHVAQRHARLAPIEDSVVINARGEARWKGGHPWIFRSDITVRPAALAGAVTVRGPGSRMVGCALWSPRSEISLRMLTADPSPSLDVGWWRSRIAAAILRRRELTSDNSARRIVHGEADQLPSLVVDQYGSYLVLQLLSAGLEEFRSEIVAALVELLHPLGILARNDAGVRDREGLPREVVLLHGEVPRDVEIRENGLAYLAAPWDGQKTGAFLDQRENRIAISSLAKGASLDCFSYHGSFALHLSRASTTVLALDSSAAALERAQRNFALNKLANISTVQADAFDFLRLTFETDQRFDTIVLDPPAFAKEKSALDAAMRGYKEVNLRAMLLLRPGGTLLSASCSHHLTLPLFLEMLRSAAADSGRRIVLREIRGQASDHPEVLNIPESGYLKAAILQVDSADPPA